MLLVISPAKKLDFDTPANVQHITTPNLLKKSEILVQEMRKKTTSDLKRLMKVSDAIAELNVGRFKHFSTPFTNDNAKPALPAFKGDVYANIDTASFTQEDFDYAQDHLRILSGLYGVLRPLDLMQAYRLEMGTRLKNSEGADLYEFWGDTITEELNAALANSNDDTVINLASGEYWKAVKPKKINGNIINVAFKEYRGGTYKTIGLNAKRARGMMVDFIIRNRIKTVEEIKSFDRADYIWNKELSKGQDIVFSR